MLERFGRDDEAIKYYEAAKQIDPNNTFALRRLADLYVRVGKLDESQNVRTELSSLRTGTSAVSLQK